MFSQSCALDEISPYINNLREEIDLENSILILRCLVKILKAGNVRIKDFDHSTLLELRSVINNEKKSYFLILKRGVLGCHISVSSLRENSSESNNLCYFLETLRTTTLDTELKSTVRLGFVDEMLTLEFKTPQDAKYFSNVCLSLSSFLNLYDTSNLTGIIKPKMITKKPLSKRTYFSPFNCIKSTVTDITIDSNRLSAIDDDIYFESLSRKVYHQWLRRDYEFIFSLVYVQQFVTEPLETFKTYLENMKVRDINLEDKFSEIYYSRRANFKIICAYNLLMKYFMDHKQTLLNLYKELKKIDENENYKICFMLREILSDNVICKTLKYYCRFVIDDNEGKISVTYLKVLEKRKNRRKKSFDLDVLRRKLRYEQKHLWDTEFLNLKLLFSIFCGSEIDDYVKNLENKFFSEEEKNIVIWRKERQRKEKERNYLNFGDKEDEDEGEDEGEEEEDDINIKIGKNDMIGSQLVSLGISNSNQSIIMDTPTAFFAHNDCIFDEDKDLNLSGLSMDLDMDKNYASANLGNLESFEIGDHEEMEDLLNIEEEVKFIDPLKYSDFVKEFNRIHKLKFIPIEKLSFQVHLRMEQNKLRIRKFQKLENLCPSDISDELILANHEFQKTQKKVEDQKRIIRKLEDEIRVLSLDYRNMNKAMVRQRSKKSCENTLKFFEDKHETSIRNLGKKKKEKERVIEEGMNEIKNIEDSIIDIFDRYETRKKKIPKPSDGMNNLVIIENYFDDYIFPKAKVCYEDDEASFYISRNRIKVLWEFVNSKIEEYSKYHELSLSLQSCLSVLRPHEGWKKKKKKSKKFEDVLREENNDKRKSLFDTMVQLLDRFIEPDFFKFGYMHMYPIVNKQSIHWFSNSLVCIKNVIAEDLLYEDIICLDSRCPLRFRSSTEVKQIFSNIAFTIVCWNCYGWYVNFEVMDLGKRNCQQFSAALLDGLKATEWYIEVQEYLGKLKTIIIKNENTEKRNNLEFLKKLRFFEVKRDSLFFDRFFEELKSVRKQNKFEKLSNFELFKSNEDVSEEYDNSAAKKDTEIFYFNTHALLDNFVFDCRLKEQFFREKYPGKYQLLSGFDRAFSIKRTRNLKRDDEEVFLHMDQVRDDMILYGTGYRGCPFEIHNFHDLVKIYNRYQK